ncbi:hypothetical protein, partial [Streptomyces bohaiensis]|uniref:hypothetical protein n=2 Tax=Streptomyces bohaiensis TaxID=1431344 RepID=UPI0030C78078
TPFRPVHTVPHRPPVPPAPLAAPAVPRAPRSPLRVAAVALCVVLAAGLLGGAAVGTWLTTEPPEVTAAERAFDERRALWRDLPVDELFPPRIAGEGAGPGDADRVWIRTGVAPDSGCAEVFDPALLDALAQAGCHRVIRATYTDDTETSVTTVGLLFTRGGPEETRELHRVFTDRGLATRPDMMPLHHAAAAPDGDPTAVPRATWTVRVLTDAPVVVFAVTGFADGRAAGPPQTAADATAADETTVAALAGLGHDTRGIADRIERRVRKAADTAGEAV